MRNSIYLTSIFSLGILIIISAIFTSCKHKTNFEELTEISYSKDITKIINSNCAFSGCHGFSNYKKFSLMTYEGLINAGVSAGSPQTSEIYSVIKTLNENEIMPKKPYNELTEKEIQLIYIWIGQGAKNN
ncbi:MAG: hypothetical protein JNM51_11680 [Bacteroidia bacterium]|nr:hypothetical protein [Bacteroidia bacterium]